MSTVRTHHDRCWPVLPEAGRAPVVTQEFRPIGHPEGGHLGLDMAFARVAGDPPPAKDGRSAAGRFYVPGRPIIVSCAPGRVRYAYKHRTGFCVRLEHQSTGSDSLYLHMTDLHVSPGQFIGMGTVLGHMGADPSDPEGFIHLHFELRNRGDNQAFDPQQYLEKWQVLWPETPK